MIEAVMKGHLSAPNGPEVDVQLAYDEDNDPLAVQFRLQAKGEEEVYWTIGRNLLIKGSMSMFPYGDGDVQFRANPIQGVLVMCLEVPEGHADIVMPHDQVILFLQKTIDAVRPGSEDEDEIVGQRVDAFLEGLAEEEAT